MKTRQIPYRVGFFSLWILRIFASIFILFMLGCETGGNYSNQSSLDSANVIATKNQIPDSLVGENKVSKDGKRIGGWILYFNSKWDETTFQDALYYRKLNYQNGKPFGLVKDFYKNGVLQWKGHLSEDVPYDKLTGKNYWYSSNGTLEKVDFYLNGELNGKQIIYFSNGEIKTIAYYKAGVLNGDHLTYDKNGNVIEKKKYKNGELNGKYKFYFGNKILTEGAFKNGNKVGVWKYYDLDGDYKTTRFEEVRIGAICNDGSRSNATGRGACSHHGGVNYWLIDIEEVTIGGTGKYRNYY